VVKIEGQCRLSGLHGGSTGTPRMLRRLKVSESRRQGMLRVRTIVCDLVGVIQGLSDVRKIRPEGKLVDDMREVHY
jgi:hypothetical protein